MVKLPKRGYYATHPEKSNELYLLQLAKSADSEQAKAAKSQLIIQNEGFLKSTVNSWIYDRRLVDFDFLLEEARVAFLFAIEKYDLQFDTSLRSFASCYLAELRRKSFEKSKFVELTESHDVEACFILNPDFKFFDLKEKLLEAVFGSLTSIEQEVIQLHFFKGMKKREIALIRQCSEPRICNIVKNALPKLKSYLQKQGLTPGFLELN